MRNAQILLRWGAAVDPRDKSGATPLFVACEHGNELVASCLLEWGADPMRSNNSGESPLYIACLRGHWPVVQVLLNHLVWNNIPWQVTLSSRKCHVVGCSCPPPPPPPLPCPPLGLEEWR